MSDEKKTSWVTFLPGSIGSADNMKARKRRQELAHQDNEARDFRDSWHKDNKIKHDDDSVVHETGD